MVIPDEVVLSANRNTRPVAVGVLLGRVDFVFGIGCGVPCLDAVLAHILGRDFSREVFRVLLVPVRMRILYKLAGWLAAFIHRRRQDLEVADAIVTDGMSRQW